MILMITPALTFTLALLAYHHGGGSGIIFFRPS